MNCFNRLLKNNCHLIVVGPNRVVFHEMNGDLVAMNQKVASIFGTTVENLYQLQNIDVLWDQWVIINESGQPVTFEETPFVRAAKTRTFQTQTLIIRLKNGDDRWRLFTRNPYWRKRLTDSFLLLSSGKKITLFRIVQE